MIKVQEWKIEYFAVERDEHVILWQIVALIPLLDR